MTVAENAVPEMSNEQRKQAARTFLLAARQAGKPEPTAKELIAAVPGLPAWMAFEIKKDVRGGPVFSYPRKAARRQRERVPADESWAIIQDYMAANPGTYSRRELSKATGVPESTISRLWQERFGANFTGKAASRPEPKAVAAPLQPVRWKPGDTFTIVGPHGDDIIADYDGILVRLSVKPLI